MGNQLQVLTLEQLEKMVPPVVRRAQEIVIASTAEYEEACYFLKHVAERKRQVAETFDPIIRKAYEAHREAVAQRKKFDEPLIQAEGLVKRKVADYNVEQERQRAAEEARLREEARAAAQEQAIEQAQHLEAQGEKEAAQVVLEQAAQAPAPVIVLTNPVPRVPGIAKRPGWKFRIVDAAKIPREYLMPDEVKIGGIVRAMKGATKIDGIEVYPDDSVAVRA